jgi:hypothetical protein
MMPVLSEWDGFYGIVGSAAGTLIGLQFVVMTLINDRPVRVAPAGAAFATPTIIHFCVVLLLSAILRAPWRSIDLPAVLFGILGVAGAAYGILIARRVGRQTTYQPDWEDWSFHVALPLCAYGTLAASSVATPSYPREALFGVAAAILVLLFVAIHNAWDTVVYHVFVRRLDVDIDPKP